MLVAAVADNLFRLMAYKDEYEVARLHSDPQFLANIAGQFEGDYRLEFNLAPPLLARRDPTTGKPLKRRFGGWMLPVFRGLAALRGVRGTLFDPFGYSRERRLERELIERYRRTIDGLLVELDDENLALAVEIARLPETIRGYGHVKMAAIEAFERREAELLGRFAGRRKLARAA
jgi:indolepyruvate ferredoxin oxidoreductase